MEVKVKTDTFLRTVGYYAPESAMNEGKQQENANRIVHEDEIERG